eukprot:10714622-Lingulodinium_polyedra.AAC.1
MLGRARASGGYGLSRTGQKWYATRLRQRRNNGTTVAGRCGYAPRLPFLGGASAYSDCSREIGWLSWLHSSARPNHRTK